MTAGPASVTPPYLRPARLDEALATLAAEPRLVLAGGTDVYPAFTSRPIDRPVLDITGLDGLRGVTEADDGWRIPALTTWTDVAQAPLPALFDGLRAAARTIGGRQIQNTGTVVGNVVNASPASDGMPNLLAMDAIVEVASARGTRELPLAAFVTGYRATDLRPDELVTALRVPRPSSGAARASFRKLGSRRYLVISIVAVAAVVVIDAGVIREARVAVGACLPNHPRIDDDDRRHRHDRDHEVAPRPELPDRKSVV